MTKTHQQRIGAVTALAATATVLTMLSSSVASAKPPTRQNHSARVLAAAGDPVPVTGGSGWTLKFNDEFTGTTLNRKVWSPYWFAEGDTQNNVHTNAANVSVSAGALHLKLASATSGASVSANPTVDNAIGHVGYQHTYGYTEMRMNLPAANPNTGDGKIADWGAGWETGQHWPMTGENDIIEGGVYPSHSFHYGTSASPQANHGDVTGDYTTGWHTFGADWEPGSVTYYYDGKNVGTWKSSNVTNSPLYPLFNVGAGAPGGAARVGSVWDVDYVRIWQHAGQT